MTIEMLQNKNRAVIEGVREADRKITFMYEMALVTGKEPDPQIAVIKQLDDRVIKLLTEADRAFDKKDLREALDLIEKGMSLMKIAAVASGYAMGKG